MEASAFSVKVSLGLSDFAFMLQKIYIRGQIQCSFRLQNKNLIVMFFNENQKSKTNKKLFHDFII
jgi:hypothetical protein